MRGWVAGRPALLPQKARGLSPCCPPVRMSPLTSPLGRGPAADQPLLLLVACPPPVLGGKPGRVFSMRKWRCSWGSKKVDLAPVLGSSGTSWIWEGVGCLLRASREGFFEGGIGGESRRGEFHRIFWLVWPSPGATLHAQPRAGVYATAGGISSLGTESESAKPF
jgi:hypothetical protein